MAKGDNKRVRKAIETQRGAQTGQQQDLRNQFQTQYNDAYRQDQDLRKQMTEGYQNFNIDDMLSKYGMGGGGSVSGGIDPSRIAEFGADPYAGYKKFSEGGGMSPEFWDAFNKSMGTMEEGIGSYRNFMNTGGFSEGDLANIRARNIAPAEASYRKQAADLERIGATAANPAAFAFQKRQLDKDRARQLSESTTANEANIAQQVQQGKMFGTEGLTGAAEAQANARTRVQEIDAQLRLQGLGGMTDIEKTRLEAELQNASLNQQASSANSSRGDANAAFRAQMELARLGGMQDLYSSTPGATGQAGNFQLGLQDLAQGGNLGLIGQQIQGAAIPGDFQQALGNIGGVMNLGASIMNPISSIFGKKTGSGRASAYGGSNVYSGARGR